LEPYIYRNFNNFICISDYVQQIVGTKKQTYRVYNAVRMSFFDVHRESNPSSSRILYVGLLSPLKRPTDLIEAHRRLRESHPSLETIFCGNAESLGYLHELQSLSVEGVHFTGQLDVEDLCNELSQATVLVLPSAQENAPLVIAEAMAAGVPVVATQVGGIPEMLNYGQLGQLYKVGDIDGLVRILHTLIADPTYANSLAKIAKEVANRLFLPAEIASQTISVYRKILNTAQ
jgi:glycosyltransferase involved in cell wall biosynthesis